MRLKWSKPQENLKKITRLNYQKLVLLMAKNWYYIIITFNMLKMEFKFKYKILAKTVQHIVSSLFQ